MKWLYFSQLFYLFSNILAFFLVTKFLVFCVFLAKMNQICGRNEAIRKTLKYLFTQCTFKCNTHLNSNDAKALGSPDSTDSS